MPPDDAFDPGDLEDEPTPMEIQQLQGDINATGKRHVKEKPSAELTVEQAASFGNKKAAKARAAPKASKPAGEMAIEIANLRQQEAKLTEKIIAVGTEAAADASSTGSSSSSTSAPKPATGTPAVPTATGQLAGSKADGDAKPQLG